VSISTAMSRLSLLACACALAVGAFAAPAAHAAVPGLGGWDPDQQHAVMQAGVMHPLFDGRFHGEQHVSGTQMRDALAAIAARLDVAPVPAPEGRLSVYDFDRLLVDQLGLADVAAAVFVETRRAGLNPSARFGTEVVARQLGLRFNHPWPHDIDELYPTDAITRAEAAWSFAQILSFDGSQVAYARVVFSRYVLPRYTAAQAAALRIAVSRVGMPYVWGGEADVPQGARSPLGPQAHGGYDCSGLVWRVFKLTGLPAGRAILGRTAAQMAAEIPRPARLRLGQIAPADLVFFGPGRFWQKATERRIVHVGIAMSPNFMINSSGQGVTVAPLFEDWRVREFSWAGAL
jgi:cell wall-associated NlpC family hydrolase